MTKNQEMKEFLRNIYIPKMKHLDMQSAIDFIDDSSLRSFTKADEGKIGYSVLHLKTRGIGSRESFVNWEVVRCDVYSVSESFALIALYDFDGNAKPFKISLKNPKFAIIHSL